MTTDSLDKHMLVVGQPYNPKRSIWPEGAQYNYRAGLHELVLFYRQPRAREVRDISKGIAQFALYADGDQIILLYRFGIEAWSEAPYSWHRVSAEEQELPGLDFPPDMGASLTIILVDASTGIIRAMRLIGLGRDFTLALHHAIRDQAALPYNREQYEANLARLQSRYTERNLAELSKAHYNAGERDK